MKIKFSGILFFLFIWLTLLPHHASASTNTIVNPNQVYTYVQMTSDIQALADKFPHLIEYKSLGKSSFGREIWAVKLGNGDAAVFLNGSHHAREWVTTSLLMNMLEDYAVAYNEGLSIEGYHTNKVLDNTTIWFVPMVNPDGVTLQQLGLSVFPQETHKNLIKYNHGSTNFGRWKADGLGIDPNRQYPADWANIRNNTTGPSYSHYKGVKPLQTPETSILANFTYQINPEIAVSYHSTGKILYWNFHTKPENVGRDKRIADIFSKITGYRLVQPSSNPSGGGFTDWFIQEFDRPGFTPELCSYLPESSYASGQGAILNCVNGAIDENRSVGLFIADEGYKLWNKKTTPINQELTVLEKTTLYNQPLTKTNTSSISPQTVSAFQQQGEWYRINTWLGPKWIKDTNVIEGKTSKIDEPLTIVATTHLYDHPLENRKRNERVSPQRVQAFEEWNGWYRIHTWVGPKWVNSNDAILFQPKEINETITILTTTHLYDQPLESRKRSERVAPQPVQAFEEWNNWYHINTWLGPKWITGNDVMVGKPEQINETITIAVTTHLYDKPLQTSKRNERVAPQRVQAFEKWNEWYHINTWLGPKWIHETDVMLGQPQQINETLTLVTTTNLYDEPIESSRTTGRVAPQKVQAFEEWNGWYHITTWLGPKWIKQ